MIPSMLAVLYPISFSASLLFLILWLVFMQRKSGAGLRFLFILSALVWVATIATSNVGVEYKLMVGFRDLMVLGFASLLANWAKENLALAIGLVVGNFFFLGQIYMPVLKSTFIERPSVDFVQVDPEAELIIDMKPAFREDLEKYLSAYDYRLQQIAFPENPEETHVDEWFTLDLRGDDAPKIQEVFEDLSSSAFIDWVEFNELVHLSPIEDKLVEGSTINAFEFGVNDPDATKLWSFQVLGIPDLHKMLQSPLVSPRKKALIAILDTGVDGKHEDLKDNFVSTKATYDKDVQGHGTHVAGIVGAVTNNSIGIASMTTDRSYFSITSIKVLSDFGFGSQANIIKGMIEAADLGADVISMSLGGPSNDEKQKAYTEAVTYCRDKGSIVVVAAGNSSSNAANYTPANVDGVISVSAIDDRLRKTSFSNSVENLKMGIAAPGDNIYSTFPKNQYKAQRGTSMAAPFVSSLLGIMRSIQPDISTEDAYAILDKTGISSKHPKETGQIIQPAAAVRTLLD